MLELLRSNVIYERPTRGGWMPLGLLGSPLMARTLGELIVLSELSPGFSITLVGES